jgi:hypothetical protein
LAVAARCARRSVLVLALLACAACSAPPPVATQRLTVVTGDDTGVYYLLGHALAGIYGRRLPATTSSAVETSGSGFNVRAIEEGRAELAFSQADVAYLASQQGTPDHPEPYRHVRAIAVLYVQAAHIVTRRDSNIHQLADLDGRRVGIGPADSGTELTARIILREAALQHRITGEAFPFEQFATLMRDEAIDAGFLLSSYPIPAVSNLNASVSIRLLPVTVELAKRIRADYPFYRPIVIPDGTYEGQGGDVPTIGVDNLLVCRSDLPDELVYQLTRIFFESLPALARAHSAAAAIDPEQASASPIPLHPGAARFYRERELFR